MATKINSRFLATSNLAPISFERNSFLFTVMDSMRTLAYLDYRNFTLIASTLRFLVLELRPPLVSNFRARIQRMTLAFISFLEPRLNTQHTYVFSSLLLHTGH